MNYWKSAFGFAVDQTVEMLAVVTTMVVQNALSVNHQCLYISCEWVLHIATMLIIDAEGKAIIVNDCDF